MGNMNTENHILEASQIEKYFDSGAGKLQVLKGIDLNIQPGEILVIMGPSGAGKSTLLHIIGTLDKPTLGKLIIDGQETSLLKENQISEFRNRNIGFVFQFHYLLPEFTALENLYIPRMMKDDDWKKDVDRAKNILNEVGLSQRMNHLPS